MILKKTNNGETKSVAISCPYNVPNSCASRPWAAWRFTSWATDVGFWPQWINQSPSLSDTQWRQRSQTWSEVYVGNVGSQEKNRESMKQGMTNPEKPTKQYAPETGRHWVQIPIPKVPSALKLHFLFTFAQEHYRGTHQSISSLAKAIIIRQDRDSWGHRKKSANKPGWSTERGGTMRMETRKLWESHE